VCLTTLLFFLFDIADNNDNPPWHHKTKPVLQQENPSLSSQTDPNAKKNASTSTDFRLTQLRVPDDYQRFTVRINSWKRPEQLQVSIAHHQSCKAVAHIQVVWCIDQGEVPSWLTKHHQNVTVELHAVNTLNERFHVLQEEPPTAGVLSIDDDVLRPCLALESGFRKWTMNPDRQVGFDARSHSVNAQTNRWSYAYMSTTEKTNQYSTTLTRCSFLHRDYLRWYMTEMPAVIRDMVATKFNCEDIAMSLAISSLTGGRPPLLADYWAVKSQIKLYVESKISGGNDHKQVRDDCMDYFAEVLHLKDRLKTEQLQKNDPFDYGAQADNWNWQNAMTEMDTIQRWKTLGFETMKKEVGDLRVEASHTAYDRGLLEGSHPWKKRFTMQNMR
jgi:glucuronyl/N-acetylglucosaminyl transferase EXT2